MGELHLLCVMLAASLAAGGQQQTVTTGDLGVPQPNMR